MIRIISVLCRPHNHCIGSIIFDAELMTAEQAREELANFLSAAKIPQQRGICMTGNLWVDDQPTPFHDTPAAFGPVLMEGARRFVRDLFTHRERAAQN